MVILQQFLLVSCDHAAGIVFTARAFSTDCFSVLSCGNLKHSTGACYFLLYRNPHKTAYERVFGSYVWLQVRVLGT